MYKLGKLGRDGNKRNTEKRKLPKSPTQGGRDILRRDAQFRIAPKHPGMGRR